MNYRIKVYVLETISSPFKDPVKTLASPTASELGAGAESVIIILSNINGLILYI